VSLLLDNADKLPAAVKDSLLTIAPPPAVPSAPGKKL